MAREIEKTSFRVVDGDERYAAVKIVDREGEGKCWEIWDCDGVMEQVGIRVLDFAWDHTFGYVSCDVEPTCVYFPRDSIVFRASKSNRTVSVKIKAKIGDDDRYALYRMTERFREEDVDFELIKRVVDEANEFMKVGPEMAF
jgi:hypothetical protein